jgi:hypothetical protein
LNLDSVTVEPPFEPGAWCPLLEELDLFCCKIEQARVDIRLPRLKFVQMDSLDVSPKGEHDGPPFGLVNLDAPELVELDVVFEPGCTRDFKSFTMRAPSGARACRRRKAGRRKVGEDSAPVGLLSQDGVLPGADDADAPGAPSGRAARERR